MPQEYRCTSTPRFLRAGIRLSLAGELLFAYTLATGAGHINRRLLPNALITGSLLVILGNGLVVVAEQHVSSGIATLTISMESVFILLLAVFYGHRLRLGQVAGIVLPLFFWRLHAGSGIGTP